MPLVIKRREGQGIWFDATLRIELVKAAYNPGWVLVRVTHPEPQEPVRIEHKQCANVADVEICVLSTSPHQTSWLVIKTPNPKTVVQRDEVLRRQHERHQQSDPDRTPGAGPGDPHPE